jgi:HD-GYP domain-containing protein (c-di-GMP phosphodiesterase class II)
VAAIAETLGAGLGLRRKSLKDLRIAALFHDIGKIAVPVSILNKKGSLTSEEFEIVKRHTADSAEIIQDFEELAHLSDFIRHHHEKMDGSGYPSGLKGEEIPLFSRIIAVADIFEALVGERPYRQPMAPCKALSLMESEMSLDPVVLSVLRVNMEGILKVLKIKGAYLISA